MGRIFAFVVLFLLFVFVSAEQKEVNLGLVQFMKKLSPPEKLTKRPNFGWNLTSDPCFDTWQGVLCDQSGHVTVISLDEFDLTGTIDAASLCKATRFVYLTLSGNNLQGVLPSEISKCRQLIALYLNFNNLSGPLPDSLSTLINLKYLVIRDNHFVGELPRLSRSSGLQVFSAENNHFSGEIPKPNFPVLGTYNVSENDLVGTIPDEFAHFDASNFLGNPGLCGKPLPNVCP